MVTYTNSFIDRQILSLLIEPIRRDLQISDTQVSLLAGLAFSIFYTLAGIPIARLADRGNRRTLIAAGVSLWSLMTALCGLARNFPQLFLARIGVGIGEATLSPAAMSIIADYFPVSRLARAISVFSMGIYFGAGLAMVIGGLVISMVAQAGSITLPLFGEIFPWQVTFIIVGLLGIPVVLLNLTIREPVRRGTIRQGSAEARTASSFAALRGFLRLNRRLILFHFATFSFIGIAISGYFVWTPTFFIRTYGWEASRIGFVFGIILFFAGTAGVYAGGFLADWLQKRGRDDAIFRAALYGIGMMLPFAVLTPLMPTAGLAVAGLTLTIFFLALPQGLPTAALQVITPNSLRAQITAVYFLVGNLIANGLGPTFYALVTDYVFADPAMLRYSMALVIGVILPLAGLCCYLAIGPYRASVQRAKALRSPGD